MGVAPFILRSETEQKNACHNKESGYRNTAGSMPAVFHIMHTHIRARFN